MPGWRAVKLVFGCMLRSCCCIWPNLVIGSLLWFRHTHRRVCQGCFVHVPVFAVAGIALAVGIVVVAEVAWIFPSAFDQAVALTPSARIAGFGWSGPSLVVDLGWLCVRGQSSQLMCQMLHHCWPVALHCP